MVHLLPNEGFLQSTPDTAMLFSLQHCYLCCVCLMACMRECIVTTCFTSKFHQINCIIFSSVNAGGTSGSCSTSVAVTAVVSCAVSLIIAALVGAVVHYCAVRKKSKCHKFYSLTIARKQQKQQPAPVYEDIVAQKGTVDPTHIELRENITYGPVQN